MTATPTSRKSHRRVAPSNGTAAAAKITAPQLSRAYPRTRLFREIDRARRHAIVWVAAPAGYGKTTLVAHYLKTRKLPTLWYQVDAGDADIATFFHYFSFAAQRAAPRACRSLPLFTPEHMANLPNFARRYFEQLSTCLPARTVMVLDDYQTLASDALLHDVIHNGGARIPRGMTIIVISRREPPAAFVGDRANGMLAILGEAQLRLTAKESLEISRMRLPRVTGRRLADAARGLHATTHGWAAGLVLMIERWNANGDVTAAPADSARETLFDYFYREQFSSADANTRELLLTTAFLPTVTTTAAVQLAQNPRAPDILARLHRDNFFTLRRARPALEYQYHPLLREYLRNRAQAELGATRCASLIRASAEMLEQAARIEDAAQLLQSASDHPALAALVKRHAPALLARGSHHTLLTWLKSLPAALLEHDPWLLYWRGICTLPFDVGEARTTLTHAYGLFRATADPIGALLAAAGAVEAIVFEWDDFRQLARWVEALHELTSQKPAFPTPEVEARVTVAMFVALVYYQPWHADIELWAQRVQAIVAAVPDPNTRILIGAHLYTYRLLSLGELAEADTVLHSLRPPRGAALSPTAEILWYTCVANGCWMTNRPEQGLAAIASARRVLDRHGISLWGFFLTATAAAIHLSRGDSRAAEADMAHLETHLTPQRRLDVLQYRTLEAWATLARGDHIAALAMGRELVRVTADHPGPLTSFLADVTMAQALVLAGEAQQAAVLACRGLESGRRMRSSVAQYFALCCMALACLDSGRRNEGLDHLRDAFGLGRVKGYAGLMYFLLDSRMLARLCTHALDAAIETDYARAIIRERGLLPPAEAVSSEAWPWPLKIYSLRGFAVVNNDKRAAIHARVQQKPIELLKALIAHGGRDVPNVRLAQALWPEADGDRAQRSLITNLHRLRRLLGGGQSLMVRDGTVSLNPDCCWVDAWACERLLEETDAAQLQRGVALYRGRFLSSEESVWAMPARERLHAKFVRALSQLGQQHEARGDWAAAIECYEKGLQSDPLIEAFYYRLMWSHYRLGRSGDAIAVYRRCLRTLRAELDIQPGAEITKLYDTIRAAHRGDAETSA